jgi:hypothetical protein
MGSTAQNVYGVSQPMLDYRLRVSGAYTIQSRSIQAVSKSRRPFTPAR